MCDAFGCLPSQLDDEDPRLLLRIVQLRAYEQTWQAIEHAEKQSDVPSSPMTEMWARVRRLKMQGE